MSSGFNIKDRSSYFPHLKRKLLRENRASLHEAPLYNSRQYLQNCETYSNMTGMSYLRNHFQHPFEDLGLMTPKKPQNLGNVTFPGQHYGPMDSFCSDIDYLHSDYYSHPYRHMFSRTEGTGFSNNSSFQPGDDQIRSWNNCQPYQSDERAHPYMYSGLSNPTINDVSGLKYSKISKYRDLRQQQLCSDDNLEASHTITKGQSNIANIHSNWRELQEFDVEKYLPENDTYALPIHSSDATINPLKCYRSFENLQRKAEDMQNMSQSFKQWQLPSEMEIEGSYCTDDNFTELELLRGDEHGVIKTPPYSIKHNIPKLDVGHEDFWDSPLKTPKMTNIKGKPNKNNIKTQMSKQESVNQTRVAQWIENLDVSATNASENMTPTSKHLGQKSPEIENLSNVVEKVEVDENNFVMVATSKHDAKDTKHDAKDSTVKETDNLEDNDVNENLDITYTIKCSGIDNELLNSPKTALDNEEDTDVGLDDVCEVKENDVCADVKDIPDNKSLDHLVTKNKTVTQKNMSTDEDAETTIFEGLNFMYYNNNSNNSHIDSNIDYEQSEFTLNATASPGLTLESEELKSKRMATTGDQDVENWSCVVLIDKCANLGNGSNHEKTSLVKIFENDDLESSKENSNCINVQEEILIDSNLSNNSISPILDNKEDSADNFPGMASVLIIPNVPDKNKSDEKETIPPKNSGSLLVKQSEDRKFKISTDDDKIIRKVTVALNLNDINLNRNFLDRTCFRDTGKLAKNVAQLDSSEDSSIIAKSEDTSCANTNVKYTAKNDNCKYSDKSYPTRQSKYSIAASRPAVTKGYATEESDIIVVSEKTSSDCSTKHSNDLISKKTTKACKAKTDKQLLKEQRYSFPKKHRLLHNRKDAIDVRTRFDNEELAHKLPADVQSQNCNNSGLQSSLLKERLQESLPSENESVNFLESGTLMDHFIDCESDRLGSQLIKGNVQESAKKNTHEITISKTNPDNTSRENQSVSKCKSHKLDKMGTIKVISKSVGSLRQSASMPLNKNQINSPKLQNNCERSFDKSKEKKCKMIKTQGNNISENTDSVIAHKSIPCSVKTVNVSKKHLAGKRKRLKNLKANLTSFKNKGLICVDKGHKASEELDVLFAKKSQPKQTVIPKMSASIKNKIVKRNSSHSYETNAWKQREPKHLHKLSAQCIVDLAKQKCKENQQIGHIDKNTTKNVDASSVKSSHSQNTSRSTCRWNLRSREKPSIQNTLADTSTTTTFGKTQSESFGRVSDKQTNNLSTLEPSKQFPGLQIPIFSQKEQTVHIFKQPDKQKFRSVNESEKPDAFKIPPKKRKKKSIQRRSGKQKKMSRQKVAVLDGQKSTSSLKIHETLFIKKVPKILTNKQALCTASQKTSLKTKLHTDKKTAVIKAKPSILKIVGSNRINKFKKKVTFLLPESKPEKFKPGSKLYRSPTPLKVSTMKNGYSKKNSELNSLKLKKCLFTNEEMDLTLQGGEQLTSLSSWNSSSWDEQWKKSILQFKQIVQKAIYVQSLNTYSNKMSKSLPNSKPVHFSSESGCSTIYELAKDPQMDQTSSRSAFNSEDPQGHQIDDHYEGVNMLKNVSIPFKNKRQLSKKSCKANRNPQYLGEKSKNKPQRPETIGEAIRKPTSLNTKHVSSINHRAVKCSTSEIDLDICVAAGDCTSKSKMIGETRATTKPIPVKNTSLMLQREQSECQNFNDDITNQHINNACFKASKTKLDSGLIKDFVKLKKLPSATQKKNDEDRSRKTINNCEPSSKAVELNEAHLLEPKILLDTNHLMSNEISTNCTLSLVEPNIDLSNH